MKQDWLKVIPLILLGLTLLSLLVLSAAYLQEPAWLGVLR